MAVTTSGLGHGVNLQPSYFNNGDVDLGWSLMDQWPNIQTVRLEIDPVKSNGLHDIKVAQRWVREAKAHQYSVICTYHNESGNGSPRGGDLQAAAGWWVDNYKTLDDPAGPNSVIINLMNEWGDHNVTTAYYVEQYNQAIGTIRDGLGYTRKIIIDCPGWAQEATTAFEAVTGATGPRISDPDIILSAHVYPGANNQKKKSPDKTFDTSDIDLLDRSGVPCIVGEFGPNVADPANVRCLWQEVVKYAKGLGMTVLGWAWDGDGPDATGTRRNMIQPQFTAPHIHTVQKGDTLSAIAKRYYGAASKYRLIFEANRPPLVDPDKIYPGQRLKIPVSYMISNPHFSGIYDLLAP